MFFDRTSGGKRTGGTKRTSKTKTFQAPFLGWVRSSVPGFPRPGMGALLDNAFPTSEGVRPRKGTITRATISGAVTHLTSYEYGATSKFFATDAGNIYDITSPADPEVAETPITTGLSSGDWSSLQFTTTGGVAYTLLVNGTDEMQAFDGTNMVPLTDEAVYAMDYDAETGTFTAGLTVSGGTSGASAEIVKVVDNGTTGTLWIRNITSGPFQNDETITDTSTGSATSDIPSGVETLLAATITGKATTAFSHLWSFKRFLFLIEGGTMSAWYLPVGAIGGPASEIPLGSIFKLGGVLVFGGTWSQDSGDGLDDYCVFVTSKGQVAIYQGTDPGSASTWSLVGVYRIGEPLHKNAHFQAGGDLVVMTDEGIVPISAAVQKDRVAIRQTALTAPIEEEWRELMDTRKGLSTNFSCVLWPKAAMLLVGLPTGSGQTVKAHACNAITGAWSSGFLGWDVRCCAVYDDKLYFGTGSNTIKQGDVGGDDDGDPYQVVILPSFDMLGTPNEKICLHARATIKTNYPFTFEMFANTDYVLEKPAQAAADSISGADVWGTGLWGTMVWQAGDELKAIRTEWQTVHGTGETVSPGFSFTSGNSLAPDIELTNIQLVYEIGDIMA